MHYFRAASNTRFGYPNTTPYYEVELWSGDWNQPSCTAIVTITRSGWVLGQTTVPCYNGMIFRSFLRDNKIWAFDLQVDASVDSSWWANSAGVGARDGSPNNYLSDIKFGYIDTVPPSAVSQSSVLSTVSSTTAEFRW